VSARMQHEKGEREAPRRKKRVAYLCLQATQEGQASHAHVHEIIHGLRKRGWRVRLFEPLYGLTDLPARALKRAVEFLWVQLALLSRIFSVEAIYIRRYVAAFPTAVLRGPSR